MLLLEESYLVVTDIYTNIRITVYKTCFALLCSAQHQPGAGGPKIDAELGQLGDPELVGVGQPARRACIDQINLSDEHSIF